jgi:hypothetical protein
MDWVALAFIVGMVVGAAIIAGTATWPWSGP